MEVSDPNLFNFGERELVIVHGEANYNISGTLPRLPEHHSRQRVQTYEGLLRLEHHSGIFQRVSETLGSIEVDPTLLLL